VKEGNYMNMDKTKYLININWTPDCSYVSKWVMMTMDNYKRGFDVNLDDWNEMVENNAIIKLDFWVSYFIEELEAENVELKVELDKYKSNFENLSKILEE